MQHISIPVARVMERMIATARGEAPPVWEETRRSPHWGSDEWGHEPRIFHPGPEVDTDAP